MRLIDADKLEPKFIHGRWEETYISNTELMNAPTVDAVPIVRCKDCVHKDVPCPLYGGSQFFCAYGDRGEDNEGCN